jgi:hypothetical protein
MRRITWAGWIAILCSAVAGSEKPSRQEKKPVFKNEGSTLRLGLDGKVYVSSGTLFIRCNRDGSEPAGAPPGASLSNATANADGIIAAAYAHFAKNVTLFDAGWNVLGRFARIADAGFRSPGGVAAGPSGDFYALDQGRDQVVRFHPDGIRCGLYRIPREPAGPGGELSRFRVCEKTATLYVVDRAPLIRCFSFDTPEFQSTCRKLWEIPVEGTLEAGCELFHGYGGFDVDENGVLYVLKKTGDVVQSYDPQGRLLKELKPDWGELKPGPAQYISGLQVSKGEAFIQRNHPTELFQRFDLATGKRKDVARVPTDYSALMPGHKTPFEGRPIKPVVSEAGLPAGHGKPLRVLFIGNSQVNCVCDIPDIVEDLSRSSKDTKTPLILADEVVVGGVGLEGYWKNGLAQQRIAAGGWDWIVINEIVYSYGGNTAKFQEYARRFDQEAKKAGARMLYFATGEVEIAKSRQGAMYRDALAMARETRGRVAGAGMAWQRAWEEQSKLDFHHTDRAHPNAKGYYLNACVIFAALTDRSPLGLGPFSLPPGDAEFLQKIAWAQHLEDRSQEEK